MRGQDAANLLADAGSGMKRQGGFLKDEGDATTADVTEFFRGGLEKIFAFKKNGAVPDVTVGRKKAQDRCRERALARAGFAEDAQNFAGHQAETYARQNRPRPVLVRPIGNLKILDFENRLHGPATIGLPPLRFMLRQEARRDKGNMDEGGPKVIRRKWRRARRVRIRRIAGIQEGGIPAIRIWA